MKWPSVKLTAFFVAFQEFQSPGQRVFKRDNGGELVLSGAEGNPLGEAASVIAKART